MKIKRKYNSYEGMGFIESLIAIMVVGVASVALMRIAATTMSDAVENERIDKMTQYAIEGANMTENIVQEFYEYKNEEPASSFFGNLDSTIKCYIPQPSNSEPGKFEFREYAEEVIVYSIPSLGIEAINNYISKPNRENAKIMTKNIDGETVGSGFFRLACFYPYNPTTDKQIKAGIVVGHLASEGTYTARRNVRHYIYSTVIPLR